MTSKKIIITGSNSGLGKEAAKVLSSQGHEIIMAVRNLQKGEEAKAEILKEFPKANLELKQLDVASLASIRDFAKKIENEPIDILVNNAGVMVPPERLETADGFELQIGTNFLGPFLLTQLLIPNLLKTTSPRVTITTSMASNFGKINFEDLNWKTRKYSTWAAYCQSKLADTYMGLGLIKQASEKNWNITTTLAHPGYTRTNLQSAGGSLGESKGLVAKLNTIALDSKLVPQMNVQDGTLPLIKAIIDDVPNGSYWGPKHMVVGTPPKEAKLPKSAKSNTVRDKLWDLASDLVGL